MITFHAIACVHESCVACKSCSDKTATLPRGSGGYTYLPVFAVFQFLSLACPQHFGCFSSVSLQYLVCAVCLHGFFL